MEGYAEEKVLVELIGRCHEYDADKRISMSEVVALLRQLDT